MILYEHEGKELLAKAGLTRPRSQLLSDSHTAIKLGYPLMLKAQVLSGKRAAAGGIIKVETDKKLQPSLLKLFTSHINQEAVKQVLVEEVIIIEQAWYFSLSYDTLLRAPVLSWSAEGGTDIEERRVNTCLLDPLSLAVPVGIPLPTNLIRSLIDLFWQQDSLLVEINPLVYGADRSGKKAWYVLDAKIRLDDTAADRHSDWAYSPRAVSGHQATEREKAAKQIDSGDHRGTAGSAYFDLEGDIAVLASGGGASLVAMDTLLAAGGQPANYTEYSGNPTREKVERLTEVVLSKPGLNGLWIVGAVANFTDIYETLSGIIAGLRNLETKLSTKFDWPIVIRRGGPRVDEAFAMLKTVKDFDLHVYGPEISIAESAKVITKLAADYAKRKKI